MSNKREFGQYYTQNNPFSHPSFKEWMDKISNKTILEPFAGSNNIVKLMYESGYKNVWKCYDIEPSDINVFPEFNVEHKDTIKDFPVGYDVCVTNCPYLAKNSAKRRGIDFPWKEDDLYKVCVNKMLEYCKYVAAIIPESFITSTMNKDRLWCVISLTCKMFDDTECPVCLALFTPENNKQTKVYSNEDYIGTLEDLSRFNFIEDDDCSVWKFNDKNGNIGVKTVDNQKTNDCKFLRGESIESEKIKVSSRAFTRISGLSPNINVDEFIKVCNRILSDYRNETKDVMMTSFKGLRSDGKYRRRLDFKTIRYIMNTALYEFEKDNHLF